MFRPSLRLSLGAVLFVLVALTGTRAQAQCPTCLGSPNGPGGPNADKPLLYKVLHPIQSCECWTHHNSDFHTGSWRSETTWIFGSSRVFFGEPCFKGPPGDGSCPPPGCLYRRAFEPRP